MHKPAYWLKPRHARSRVLKVGEKSLRDSFKYRFIKKASHVFQRDEHVKNVSRREFEERANCFVYQYGNLSLPGVETNLTVHGTDTLNENIADNGGLRTAFHTYTRVLKEECENTDTRLAGLERFSGLQLFYIGNAMIWCRAKDELAKWLTYLDNHSPDIYRVNVPMQNLEAFAEAFQCSKNSAMKKEKNETCTVW
ncbi:neprilysin-11-like [Amblyomma americanum]